MAGVSGAGAGAAALTIQAAVAYPELMRDDTGELIIKRGSPQLAHRLVVMLSDGNVYQSRPDSSIMVQSLPKVSALVGGGVEHMSLRRHAYESVTIHERTRTWSETRGYFEGAMTAIGLAKMFSYEPAVPETPMRCDLIGQGADRFRRAVEAGRESVEAVKAAYRGRREPQESNLELSLSLPPAPLADPGEADIMADIEALPDAPSSPLDGPGEDGGAA